MAHVNSAASSCVGGGRSGAGGTRLHDINGAHFVHFICVICQPKCVAFSLLIYRARTGYLLRTYSCGEGEKKAATATATDEHDDRSLCGAGAVAAL